MIRLFALLASEIRLLTAALGLGLLAAGFALAWMPLAFIVPGGLLVGLAVGGAVIEARARAVPRDRRAQ